MSVDLLDLALVGGFWLAMVQELRSMPLERYFWQARD
jgi:hypothetical protein